MLECYGPDDKERAGIDDVQGVDDVNWMLGRRIAGPLPAPIKITLDADDGLMMPMFYRRILLFRDDLIVALKAAGVDNLDLYDTVLTNPKTGDIFTNYKAVNIIGIVAVADLSKSKYEAHGLPLIDVDFDSLVIDESQARDLLMFRLAECVSGIVVHEGVKKVVEQHRIPHLDWIEPSDWVG
jgi:hypothetical protein